MPTAAVFTTNTLQVVASALALGQVALLVGRFIWRKARGRQMPRFLTLPRLLGFLMLAGWVALLYQNQVQTKVIISSGIVALFLLVTWLEYRDWRRIRQESPSQEESSLRDLGPDSQEHPSGTETKYPSGRQDANPTPPTVAVGAQPSKAPSSEDLPPEVEESRPSEWREAGPPTRKFSYRQNGDKIDLRLRHAPPTSFVTQLYCEVEEPRGIKTRVPAGDILAKETTVSVLYPFESAPPLVDGEYVVRWRHIGLLVFGPGVLAEGAFRVRGGRLVN
jgi:hypothetical protein